MASIHDLIPWRETRGTNSDSIFDSLRHMQREMDSVFNNFLSTGGSLPASSRQGKLSFAPSLDIAETEKSYHLTMELPGVSEKDVEITITDGVLTVRGEKKSEEKQEDKNWHRVERFYGSFQRSVSLPQEVDEDHIEARFKNGVLELEVPKSTQKREKTRRIEVKAS